tara:strand:+ start:4581 stop:5879 length:1299 start_codon:yes stop_codon:yes gene_type:complete
MDFLDKDLLKVVDKLINDSNRKNKAASHYWYPLNYATYGKEEITSALQSMIIFQTSMHEKTKLFETMFSEYICSKSAVFLNSGSSADLLAMNVLVKSPEYDVKKNDKVLVPAITWPTQIWAIIQSGLVPVLYDCDEFNFNPDVSRVPKSILDEVKIIFTTHILGTCCDIDNLIDICGSNKIYLAEDACESLGTLYKGKQVGTFGEVGTFSSFFSHHITTMEGGVLCCNNKDLYNQARLLRAHGWLRAIQNDGLDEFCLKRGISISEFKEIDSRYLFLDEGYNLRPTEINASFGIHQLKKLNQFNIKRKELSNLFYKELSKLKNFSGPKIVNGCDPCFMALPFSIKAENFGALKSIKYLEERGVESRPLIAGNILKHPVCKSIKLASTDLGLKGANFHHHNSLYVGLSPKHSFEDIDRLIKIMQDLNKLIDDS